MARILNPDEVKRFQGLQDYFDVAATAKRLDDFAKWIFSAVTLVATVGTGFAMFNNQTLRPEAKIVFGIAMVLVGISLGCAVMMLSPAFPELKLGSPANLNQKFSVAIQGRRKWTLSAAAFLGLAFVAAGLSPVLSATLKQPDTIPNRSAALTYSLIGKKVTIVMQLEALKVGSPVTLKVSKTLVDPKKMEQTFVIYLNHLIVGSDGKVLSTVNLEDIAVVPLTVEYSAVKADGTSITSVEALQLATP